jgi:hypothetical protein
MPAAQPPPEIPLWQVVHAQAVGSAHLTSGLPCQDAAGWRLLPSGILAIALADGAGSAPLAEVGANLAIAEALASLENSPANQTSQDAQAWEAAVRGAFEAARDSLARESDAAGLPQNVFATTLTCLAATDTAVIFGQVGDGVLVARAPLGDLYTLTQPQRGEYANETLFLTMPDALERGYFKVEQMEVAALAVMSDGLSRLALHLPGYAPHGPFFAPLWRFAARALSDGAQASQQLAEFLASERVCARTDDDKSLVIAVRPEYDFLEVVPASLEAEE